MTIIIKEIETFARGIINETLERHNFNARTQQEGETFDNFLTEVKLLSKNCNFCATCHEGLVRDRIVAGVCDDALRKKLLSEPKLNLKKAEDICRATKQAQIGAETLKEEKHGIATTDPIHTTGQRRFKAPSFKRSTYQSDDRKELPCRFCNRTHPRGAQNCPAWGKSCIACNKRNLFRGSTVCRKQHVNNINDKGEFEEDLGALFIGSVEDTSKTTAWEIEMPAPNGYIHFKIDTGADVTVISQDELAKLNINKSDLAPTRKKLSGPAKQKLQCLGYIYLNFQWGEKQSREIVYVCKNLTRALLGKPAIRHLNIATHQITLAEK